jgi:hypothetical protein
MTPTRPTRRPYTLRDKQLIQAYYPLHNAGQVAALLGRTVGSLKSFLQDHPELKKRARF